jgi:hypothetical protein
MRERISARAIVAGAALVGVAWAAGTTHSFTWPARCITIAAAVSVLVVAACAPRSSGARRTRPERRDVPWGVVAVAAVGWQLAAYSQSPRTDHPTISSMLDAADAHAPLRAVVFLGWVALGLVLARR